MAAPGTHGGQLGEGLDLKAPPLVIGEVPVEAVELVEAHLLEQALEGGDGVEVAGTVEEDAAKTEARCIPHRQAGQALSVLQRPLGQAHQPVSPARLAGGPDDDLLRGDGELIPLGGKCRLDEVDLRIVILGQGQACQLVEMG